MKFLLGLVATAALAATAHAQPGNTPPIDGDEPAPPPAADPFAEDDRRGFEAARPGGGDGDFVDPFDDRGGGRRDFSRDRRGGPQGKNGRVDKRRKRAMMMRLAMRFDRDGDGWLSPQERQALKRFVRLRKFDRIIQRLDRDRDGRLGPGEVPPKMMHKLRRLDRDGDGWVTRDEVGMAMRGRGAR
jgi:hypothetical protein